MHVIVVRFNAPYNIIHSFHHSLAVVGNLGKVVTTGYGITIHFTLGHGTENVYSAQGRAHIIM